ncbi:hypothetical protein [Gracilimonas tropica]|uniref:hypothetical protein n=1 Tax=Gracilimonas tropica TaxID=454600 RepID=UPI00036DC209|nr:hypothetical protein [Gracilimonas tropica]
MDLKKRSREELENKIEHLERLIAKKGVGSDYLSKAERIQRDLNLALILGGTAVLVGTAAWTLLSSRGD